MNTELNLIAERLERARTPEDVFGAISGSGAERLVGLKLVYHQLAKVAHPDKYTHSEDQRAAAAAFRRLSAWYDGAEAKIRAGAYGLDGRGMVAGEAVVLETKQHTYHLDGSYLEGPVYNRYPCMVMLNGRETPALMKLVRDPRDNQLAQNEVRSLQLIRSGKAAVKFDNYLPRLVESFIYAADDLAEGEERRANVFEAPAGWYALDEVMRAYPLGLDPRDMAWIFRRVLVGLGLAHLNEVIHGAVLPGNIFILPEAHGLVLAEWSYSVSDPSAPGACVTAVDEDFTGYYPPEALKSLHAGSPEMIAAPGTDIYMAAKCMVALLGGSPASDRLPASVPGPIRAFLKGCTLPYPKSRPGDAWELLRAFDDLLHRLWGERKFHPFRMP